MLLLWIVLPFAFDVVVSILLEIVLGITHSLDEDKGARGVALLWLTAMGGLIGLATVFVAPERLLVQGPFPGLSLLLVPIALGAAMEVWVGSATIGRRTSLTSARGTEARRLASGCRRGVLSGSLSLLMCEHSTNERVVQQRDEADEARDR